MESINFYHEEVNTMSNKWRRKRNIRKARSSFVSKKSNHQYGEDKQRERESSMKKLGYAIRRIFGI